MRGLQVPSAGMGPRASAARDASRDLARPLQHVRGAARRGSGFAEFERFAHASSDAGYPIGPSALTTRRLGLCRASLLGRHLCRSFLRVDLCNPPPSTAFWAVLRPRLPIGHLLQTVNQHGTHTLGCFTAQIMPSPPSSPSSPSSFAHSIDHLRRFCSPQSQHHRSC